MSFIEISIDNNEKSVVYSQVKLSSEDFLKLIHNPGEKLSELLSQEGHKETLIKLFQEDDDFYFSLIISKSHISKISKKLEERDEKEKQRIKFHGLTKKEIAVLCFLHRGYHQTQISEIFFISINTFKQYRKNIYKKLKFKTKNDLLEWSNKYLSDFFNPKVFRMN
jgi:DNA-binding CsgD family transcriptional regulator